MFSHVAWSLAWNLLEDRSQTFGCLGHLSVYLRLYGFGCLLGNATLDDHHQLLDLCIFLAELIDDGMRTVPAAESSVVAGFLVPILLSICSRCLWVLNQNIELLNLIQYMVIVVG